MARLDDPERLEALRLSGLLTKGVGERLDHLVYSAAQLIRADATQLNALDDMYQHHISQWPSIDDIPCPDAIEDAGCREIILSEQTLQVPDTDLHPVMCRMPWTREFRGYLGTPIRYHDQVIGSLCALTNEPRVWKAYDLIALEGIARLVGMALE